MQPSQFSHSDESQTSKAPWLPKPIGNELVFENPGMVVFKNRTSILHETYAENGAFRGFHDAFGLSIQLGQVITVQGKPFKVNCMEKRATFQEGGTPTYCLYSLPTNTIGTYLLPLVEGFHFPSFMPAGYVGCFLGNDQDLPFHPQQLKLLVVARNDMADAPKPWGLWSGLLHQESFDAYHTLYTFAIQERYFETYHLLLEGRYSAIPEIHKLLILQFNGNQRNSYLKKVLYAHEGQRLNLELSLGLPSGTLSAAAEVEPPFDFDRCVLRESFKIMDGEWFGTGRIKLDPPTE
jgi:hypothetical protein